LSNPVTPLSQAPPPVEAAAAAHAAVSANEASVIPCRPRRNPGGDRRPAPRMAGRRRPGSGPIGLCADGFGAGGRGKRRRRGAARACGAGSWRPHSTCALKNAVALSVLVKHRSSRTPGEAPGRLFRGAESIVVVELTGRRRILPQGRCAAWAPTSMTAPGRPAV